MTRARAVAIAIAVMLSPCIAWADEPPLSVAEQLFLERGLWGDGTRHVVRMTAG